MTSGVDPLQLYLRLGVDRDASADSIRRAYLHLSAVFHPDRAAQGVADDVREEMRRRFQSINEAYQILGDARSRAAYDAAGTRGVRQLELVPEHARDPASVRRYVELLDQQEETKRLAKMLNASGSIELVFNAARAAKVFSLSQSQLQGLHDRMQQRRPTSVASPPPTLPLSLRPEATVADVQQTETPQPASSSASQPAAPAVAPPAPDLFTAVPVVDPGSGTTTIVLVPNFAAIREMPQETFEALVAKGALQITLSPASPAAADADAVPLQTETTAIVAPSGATASNAVTALPPYIKFRSLFPESITASHSFAHACGRRGMLTFRAGCRQARKQFDTWVALNGEFYRSQVMTYMFKLRIAAREFQLRCGFLRELNPLWSLRSELHLLDKTFFLPKFTTSLTRKWSRFWAMTNAMEWTLYDAGGSFSTTFARGDKDTDSTFFKFKLSPNGGFGVDFHHGAPGQLLQGAFDLPVAAGFTGSLDLVDMRLSAITDVWYMGCADWSFGLGLMLTAPLLSLRGPTLAQLRILYRRGDHTVTVPLVLGASMSGSAVGTWSLIGVPFILYKLAARAAVPYVKVREIRQARAKRAGALQEIRLEAERAAREVAAMQTAVHNATAREDAINGLIIRNARICLSRPLTADELHAEVPLVADVTIALQNCVRNSALSLPSGPKGALAGAFDPHPFACVHDKKVFRIEYLFRGRRHEVEVPEDEAILLPQEAHARRAAAVNADA